MVTGLILAAGESSRMGTDKALLAYRGRTFLENVVSTLREAGLEQVVIVLGHHAKEIQRVIELSKAEVVINPDYRQGQTSSLQSGLRALDRPSVSGLVLCLVDHPAVSTEVVRQLIAAHHVSHAPVVIPTYQGERGHPVILGRKLFAELLALSPGEGANTVVRKYRPATQFVEVADRGILIDVDDPETYRDLVK